MLQRRFREQERGEDDEDEGEKPGKKKKKKGGGRGGDLRIHDLEEDLEMSSDDSDSSMGDGKDVKQLQPSCPHACTAIYQTFKLSASAWHHVILLFPSTF